MYEVEHTLLRQPFQWQPKHHDVVGETANITVCRNSVQGLQFVVDERGIAYLRRKHSFAVFLEIVKCIILSLECFA